MNFNRGVIRVGAVAQIALTVWLASYFIGEEGWDKIAPDWMFFILVITVVPFLATCTGVGLVIVGKRIVSWIIDGFRDK